MITITSQLVIKMHMYRLFTNTNVFTRLFHTKTVLLLSVVRRVQDENEYKMRPTWWFVWTDVDGETTKFDSSITDVDDERVSDDWTDTGHVECV